MRRFKVVSYRWDRHPDRKRNGKISKFAVTDAVDETETEARTVAYFPVTDTYPEDQQKQLADILSNFLNGRLDAIEKTFENDALLQRIIL